MSNICYYCGQFLRIVRAEMRCVNVLCKLYNTKQFDYLSQGDARMVEPIQEENG